MSARTDLNPQAADADRAGALRELGARLRALRAKSGVTRKQLAARSATSERYLAHLEAGTGNPSLSVLMAIADALDVAVAEMLPLGGERTSGQESAAAALRRMPANRIAAFTSWILQGERGAEKGRRIVLIGLRGAGKTALGAALADRLGVPFVEMSREVERAYGADIGLLIEISGQAALRRYEREAWDDICRHHEGAVIAASGGVVADGPLFEQMLAAAHSIWLSARPEDHMSRVMAQGDMRPMASNRGAMDDLKAILAARSADYRRADATLDTSAQPFDRTLDRLAGIARALIV